MLLIAPSPARANGDPASDYLLVQSIFLPFNAKIDRGVTRRLSNVVAAANKAGFKIRVALIATRYDLGTAFSLYNKPQRYAQFLGLELSFVYRDHLLVVMPRGYGASINGKPDARGSRALRGLGAPGMEVTNEAEAATRAVRRLAGAYGHVVAADAGSGGGSQARDRITIAAGVTALVALLAAIVFFRRGRTVPSS